MMDGGGTGPEDQHQIGGIQTEQPVAGADELALIARLRRFRREHPAAEIVTEHVRLDEALAIFRATIAVPDGGKATGYGSATAQPGGGASFVELAESRAIGRALTALGFNPTLIEDAGATPTAAGDHGATSRLTPLTGRPTSSGEDRPPVPSLPIEPAPGYGSQRPGPSASSEPRPVPRSSPAPVELGAGRDRSGGPAQPPRGDRPTPVRAVPSPAPIGGDPDLADYSFTSFWKWARELGYNSKGAIEELIGQSMSGLSPLELRRRVLIARGEDQSRDD